jgi:predicted transcriptional regulator
MGDLEAMRRKDPEYLKSLLWTRINQQKMLNNTLCEMMSKNSSRKSIEMVKENLDEIMEEINNINDDIAKICK